MDANKLIGKTFAYKGIGNNGLYRSCSSIGTERRKIRRR